MKNYIDSQCISPGRFEGYIKKVTDLGSSMSVKESDVVFLENPNPFYASMGRKAAGFIISYNAVGHTIAYVREIWKPCVSIGRSHRLEENQFVQVDATNGKVYLEKCLSVDYEKYCLRRPIKNKTKTKVLLFLSLGRLAEKSLSINSDGVGLLRTNVIMQETGKHPYYYIKNKIEDELITILYNNIKKIATAFSPKPVWVRTMDFATSELRLYEGGEKEIVESNPMLGWRGIIRELEEKEIFDIEIKAVKRVLEDGLSNLGIIFPLVRDISEFVEAKKFLRQNGLKPHTDIKISSMFETPSSAIQIDKFINEGLDMAFIGVNDLTQYTLVTDRESSRMRKYYNPVNESVLFLINHVLQACKKNKIETTSSFQKPMKKFLKEFINNGLTSLSVLPDNAAEIGEVFYSIETKGII